MSTIDPPEELLSAYLDGEATPDERALVERRLEESGEWRVVLEEVRSTIVMAASGDTAVSPDLAASMLGEARRLQQLGSEDEKVISRREEEVLQLIADGASTPEVASKLFISQKTVKNHLASIYEQLDARDRTQAVLQAVRRGIVRLQ